MLAQDVDFLGFFNLSNINPRFILEAVVTPGNVHDSVAFDEVYAKVTERFPEVKTLVFYHINMKKSALRQAFSTSCHRLCRWIFIWPFGAILIFTQKALCRLNIVCIKKLHHKRTEFSTKSKVNCW